MLSEKCFIVFYLFSVPDGVYVGTLNLMASIPDPSILTLYYYNFKIFNKVVDTKTTTLIQIGPNILKVV